MLSAPRLSEEDVNVVFRVDRSRNSPGSFSTYVNGDFASTTEALKGTGGQPVDHVALTVGLDLWEPVFLAVFNQAEARKAAVFSEVMRNPGVGYFKIKALEDSEKAAEDNEKVGKDKKKALEEQEKVAEEMGKALKDKEKAIEGKGKAVEEKGKAVEEKGKAVEEKGKAVEEKGKAVEEKEKALEGKEKALEDKEKELKARESAIAERENDLKGASSRTNVQPPDADIVHDSTKAAWPRAVRRVLPSKFSNVNQRHQELMSDWVVARGDNISSDAYDYFVYSHGVVWPKAVLEITTEGNLSEIREKHKEIMKVLGY